MILRIALIAGLAAVTSGCIVRTAVDVATAPVKVVSKAADLATTSQSEADEKRGREIRRREEQLGRLEREYAQAARDCEGGDDRACRDAVALRRAMDELAETIPREAED